jgi:hypothetical protein
MESQLERYRLIQDDVHMCECELRKLKKQMEKEKEKLQQLCAEVGHEMVKEDSGDCHSTRYYKVCKKCQWFSL